MSKVKQCGYAPVHKLLAAQAPRLEELCSAACRPLCPSDYTELRRAHEDLFPVRTSVPANTVRLLACLYAGCGCTQYRMRGMVPEEGAWRADRLRGRLLLERRPQRWRALRRGLPQVRADARAPAGPTAGLPVPRALRRLGARVGAPPQQDAPRRRREGGEGELAGFITLRLVALRECDAQDRALLGLSSRLLDRRAGACRAPAASPQTPGPFRRGGRALGRVGSSFLGRSWRRPCMAVMPAGRTALVGRS